MSFLPEEYQRHAIPTGTCEVMWPRRMAPDVVRLLAATGRVVLGLDLRSDRAGATPSGFSTEVPWSSLRAAPGERVAPDVARDEALAALQRPELASMAGYDWVLITWADA